MAEKKFKTNDEVEIKWSKGNTGEEKKNFN